MSNFGLDKLSATTATKAVSTVLTGASIVQGVNAAKSLAGAITNPTSIVPQLGNQLASAAGQLLGGVGRALGNFVPELKVNLGNINENSEGKKTKNTISQKPPFANILSKFASYNYIFTISCLDNQSINFPDSTYRAGRFNQLVLASGSINPENRVNTAFGKYDFFMDDLTISHECAFSKDAKNTNIIGMRFKVIEPYSMGLFAQALQVAAEDAGYPTYLLSGSPFLLTIDFVGHTEDQLAASLPLERRLYPFTFASIQAQVTTKGTEYEIVANPYNNVAFNKSFQMIQSDTNISGETVQEMLQTGEKSLQRVINDYLKEQAKTDNREPDEIVILFPDDPSSPLQSASEDINSATKSPKNSDGNADIYSKLKLKRSTGELNKTQVQELGSVNTVGSASMGFTSARQGDSPFGKDNAIYDAEKGVYVRGNLEVNVTTSDFKFLQGTDITNVINQVVIMSDYAKQALRDGQVDDAGMVPWWRIDPQVYQKKTTANLGKTGDFPKLIVYRVVSYKVNSAILLPPGAAPKGARKLKEEAIKVYDYIYTGKNTEIIDFQINLDATFKKAVAPDGFKSSQDTKTKQQTGQDATEVDKEPTFDSGANNIANATTRQVSYTATQSSTDKKGGGGQEDISTRIARNFMDALVLGQDLVNTDLKIHGDPYFLGDSGIGNYSSPETNYRMINSDGSMNYQNTEIYIVVNFRTPTDIQEGTNVYKNLESSSMLVQSFSGLYKIQRVESRFSGGKFTQTLGMVRQVHQELVDRNAPVVSLGVNQDAGPPVDTSLQSDDPDYEQAIANIEADSVGTESSISDQEITNNNASLGDWNG